LRPKLLWVMPAASPPAMCYCTMHMELGKAGTFWQ